jgi:hypothetical protein
MITLFMYYRAWSSKSLWEKTPEDWLILVVYDVLVVSIVMIAISLIWIAFGWKIT